MSKILVAYFSHSGETYYVGNVKDGNTKIVATFISDYVKGDLYHIDKEEGYNVSLNELGKICEKEKKANARPKLKNKISNFEQYDTVFIGYPMWGHDCPMPVYTFLETYDFSNKTVIPFTTHEGGGPENTYLQIKKILNKSKVNLNGFDILGQKGRKESSRKLVEQWLKKLGF